MTKEMIRRVERPRNDLVAILEDDLVAEVFVERERQRGVVGNIRAGSRRCCPACSPPSSRLGLERDGFLYVTMIDTLEQKGPVGKIR